MSDFFTHTSAKANDLDPHYSVGVSDRQSAVALYRVGGPMEALYPQQCHTIYDQTTP